MHTERFYRFRQSKGLEISGFSVQQHCATVPLNFIKFSDVTNANGIDDKSFRRLPRAHKIYNISIVM